MIHQENGGLGAARNTGLSAAAGEYVVFLDSDDYIAPDMLETLAARIDATHCDVYTFGFFVDKDGAAGPAQLDDLPVGRPFTLEEYPRLLLATPNAWNRIYRREFFLNSGVRYPGKVWFEDIRTTMKLFALAQSVEAVDRAFTTMWCARGPSPAMPARTATGRFWRPSTTCWISIKAGGCTRGMKRSCAGWPSTIFIWRLRCGCCGSTGIIRCWANLRRT